MPDIEKDKDIAVDRETMAGLIAKATNQVQIEIVNVIFELVDMLLWVVVVLIITGKFWMQLLKTIKPITLNDVLYIAENNYVELSIGLVVLMFPVMFKQLFGIVPLGWFKLKFINRPNNQSKTDGKSDDKNQSKDGGTGVLMNLIKNFQASEPSISMLLKENVQSSKFVADAVYRKANYFLLVGGVVALLGVLLFYTSTLSFEGVDGDNVKSLWSMAPRTGVFLFIEFIAMFFLRQYRVAMGDYKYYESVKRRREEILILHKMVVKSGKDFRPDIYVKLDAFFSNVDKYFKEDIFVGKQKLKYDMDLIEAIVGVAVKNMKKVAQ
ncbi:MAG: hypothetical protein RDU30_00310 [Desulfovibrionaceae bacterium]|nr:hypothetical protein [Desulfovibrionaceae bacterium]